MMVRGVQADKSAIRRLRRAAAMTQEQLAAAVDCDVKTIRKCETGDQRVDLRIIVGVAEALAVPPEELMVAEPGGSCSPEELIEIVLRWNDAIIDFDIETFCSMHTEDTILELPGTTGLPVDRGYRGLDELRTFISSFQDELKITGYNEETLQIDVSGNHVFMRVTATIEHLQSGKSYTTRHVNEFEFRGDKIARRTTVADYELLRQIYCHELDDGSKPRPPEGES